MVEREQAEARKTSDQFGKLFKAVSSGNLLSVKSIIEDDFSIQAFKNLSSTLLHQATNNSRSQVLQFLLQHGAYVDGKNAQQMTPLHVAAHVGDARSVRVLLLNDANVNELDYDSRTPLYFAVYDGHYDCVKALLSKEDVDIRITRKGGWTHLHEAARFGHYECMKLLLETNKVNLMAKTEDAWWTPGHMAASSGRYECLKLLIESKIDVNTGGGPHRTSTLLHEACVNGHTNVAKLLLENGADPSLYDGHSLPHHIAARGGHSELLDFLLTFFQANRKYARLVDAFTNVDPASNPLTYHNALHMVSMYNRKECLRVLLRHNAKHLPNGMHYYPVMLAAFKMHIDCLKILLQEIKKTWHDTGQNVLQSDGHYSALHHLCIKTHKTDSKSIACACLLLNSGLIDIDQYDEEWDVPACLFLAARNGAVAMVQYLLNNGANPRICGDLSNYMLNNPQVKRCAGMIEDAKEEPMSLLILAKLIIRATLHKNSRIEYIHKLPLPKYLKSYVFHGHYHGITECHENSQEEKTF